jgi:ubiquinone/menaquinone biosynthesis C-methylase UbiE
MSSAGDGQYRAVLEANEAVHTRLAADYNSSEPHFRPENVRRVTGTVQSLAAKTRGRSLLDLGCGTGFVINIAKPFFRVIDGVDVCQAMLDQVDRSGAAEVNLFRSDTAVFAAPHAPYDLVTAYSFLHHLYDIGPTLENAYRLLADGGRLYVDLEPNYFFWEAVRNLPCSSRFDPLLQREIDGICRKGVQIEQAFGVDRETFDLAEYGKNALGGLKAEELAARLRAIGFREVDLFYFWFIGQGNLINDQKFTELERLRHAEIMEGMLQRVLPLSRALFKYIGCVAVK